MEYYKLFPSELIPFFLFCFFLSFIQSHGSFYTIPTGRRDGNGSVASDVAKFIPSPAATIDDLKAFFARKNLTFKDLVVLSGNYKERQIYIPVLIALNFELLFSFVFFFEKRNINLSTHV